MVVKHETPISNPLTPGIDYTIFSPKFIPNLNGRCVTCPVGVTTITGLLTAFGYQSDGAATVGLSNLEERTSGAWTSFGQTGKHEFLDT
jgi:hypothetical protein